jgi:hypothetical protein
MTTHKLDLEQILILITSAGFSVEFPSGTASTILRHDNIIHDVKSLPGCPNFCGDLLNSYADFQRFLLKKSKQE